MKDSCKKQPVNNELTKKAIRDYLKAKAEYNRLLVVSYGLKLEDATLEYEYAEAVLRSHGGTES